MVYKQDRTPTPVTPDSLRFRPVPRGFPVGFEVLTEWGFTRWDTLYSSEFLGDAVPFAGATHTPGREVKDLVWGMWETKPSFPSVATVSEVTGLVSYVRPSRFMFYEYMDRLTVFKGKGLNLRCARFTDLLVRPRYGRGWRFHLADDVTRNIQPSFYFSFLDKYNQDLYGDYNPEPGLALDLKHPFLVYPKHTRRVQVENLYSFEGGGVPVFNVDTGPGSSHAIIVREGRADDNPRTLWVGNPVVVGDGSDKSLLRVERVKASASYSTVHPEVRHLRAGRDAFTKQQFPEWVE